MPTYSEASDGFKIAALANFAKSCGLINSQQFDSVLFSGAKKLDPSVFVVKELPDWQYYDKVGYDVFKTSINNTIFSNFFKLMQTDSVFAAKMSKTVANLGRGNLTAQSLQTTIIDKMSDVVNQIAVRISSGEQLSGDQIEQLIKGGLKEKEDDIKETAENLSATTTSDGLSADTIFPNLALKQKTQGIKWRPVKGGTLSPKEVQRIKKQTDNLKKQLEKVKGGLRTARSVVALLKKLESVYSNGTVGIIQAISKILFSYVRDIGSSGVYMLDMISPFLTSKLTLHKSDNETGDQKVERMLLNKIQEENIFSTYEYMNNDIYNSTPFLSDWINPPPLEEGALKTVDDFLNKGSQFISSIYKPTTYASFISMIAESFLDEGDIPAFGFSPKDADLLGLKIDTVQSRKRMEKSFINNISNGYMNDVRPGRPTFGNGSNATVVIVAFSLPNIFNLGNIAIGSVRSFIKIMHFFCKQTSYETINMVADQHPVKKRLNRAFNKATSNKIYDYYGEKPSVDFQNNKIIVNDGITSEDPDFYGAAVRNLWPGLFKWFDAAESRMNRFLRNFKSSLAKELDNLLKYMDEMIDDLEDFIDILDNIISFFETLQTMGLYTLQITSNGGYNDIVEKLYAAKDFPGVDDGDKLRLIGGMVFCYGQPNPSPGNIDFIGIVKQKMAAMNYEASVANFESSGDSDHDPGSFDDYMQSEKIGPNYGSALDKIFKKLF